MRIVGPDELRAALSPRLVLDAVRGALIAHAEGRTTVPPPMHLVFPDVDGDAHVKAGMLLGEATFTIKLATGFPHNADHGRPTGGGALLVASARTGDVLAVLDDQGWLTAVRTAAAAALASDGLAPAGPVSLGIAGTGTQAALAAQWLRELRPVEHVLLWGRRPEHAVALAATIDGAEPIEDLARLREADVIVTATASRQALFPADAVRPGAHITALGADMPGKQELPITLLRSATLVADDLDQAQDHGEIARLDEILRRDVLLLGDVLRDGHQRTPGRTTVADLTGLGIQDAAVAEAALAALSF